MHTGPMAPGARTAAGADSLRLRAGDVIHPVDLVVALAALGVSALLGGIAVGLPLTVWAVLLGFCLPWAIRRRWPLPAFGIMVATAAGQVMAGPEIVLTTLFASPMLVASVYNVATRYRWHLSMAAALVALAWAGTGVGRYSSDLGLNIGDIGLVMLSVVTAWAVGALVRSRRQYICVLEERARQLEREKETQKRVVAAAERARIAREMHDIVSHSLSSVTLLADGASRKVHHEPDRAQQAIDMARDAARGALREMRRTLDLLRDDTDADGSCPRTPHPGLDDLEDLVADARATGLPAELTIRGEPVTLSEGLDLAVYRIVQESLTNARKHGGPELSRVEVSIDHPDPGGHPGSSNLIVRVVDDGAGESPSRVAHDDADGGGHGLVGMRERVSAVGGTIETGGQARGGYRVEARFPMDGGGQS